MAQFQFLQLLIEWFGSFKELSLEWNEGNKIKSLMKHEVTCNEAEELFEMREYLVLLGKQIRPPTKEDRYGALGLTKSGRHLFVCFTIRGQKIRVISIRKMNRKELRDYEKLR